MDQNHSRAAWIVFALAFASRALFLLAVGPDNRIALTPDSVSYLNPAEAIARHGSFSSTAEPPLVPETYRTPVYPAYLALFSFGVEPRIRGIVWSQALMGAATASLIAMLGFFLWGSPLAGWAAGVGFGLDFVSILHTGFVLTDTLFALLFTVALYVFTLALLREGPVWKWPVLAGLLFGIAALARPIGLYYFILAAPILAWKGRKDGRPGWLAGSLVFFGASLLLPLGWAARNHAATGVWTVSSIQGMNVQTLRAALVEVQRTGKSYEDAVTGLEAKLRETHPEGFESVAAESKAAGAAAAKYILQHPLDYAIVMAKDVVKFLAGNSMKAAAWVILKDPAYDPYGTPVISGDSNTTQATDLFRRHPSLGISMVLYLALLGATYLLAAWGFVAAWKHFGAPVALFAASSALYFMLVTVGGGAQARYRIPAMPAIFLLAGFGLDQALRRREKI